MREWTQTEGIPTFKEQIVYTVPNNKRLYFIPSNLDTFQIRKQSHHRENMDSKPKWLSWERGVPVNIVIAQC